MKIKSSTHIKLLFFALVSFGIKIIYFIYKYNNAFVENDYIRVSPDEYGYLMRATERFPDILFGQHWGYEFVNALGVSVFQDVNSAYIALCLFNIFLSLTLPYLMLPVIRSFSDDNEQYNKVFLGSAIIFLLMPSAIWLAASNLKDMLLAIFNISFVSLFILLSAEKRNIRRLIIFISLFAVAFLIFSLRSYLAVILLIASGTQLLIESKHKAIFFLILFSIGGIIINFVGLQESILFIEERISWLYDADAAEIISQQMSEIGQDAFVVNYNFRDSLLQVIRFYFGPFPQIISDIWENIIISVQSGVLLFFLIPLWISFRNIVSHRRNIFFVIYISLIIVFYSIGASYSGYRQRFATLDFITVLFIVRFYYAETKQLVQDIKIPSILIGCILNIAFLLFTSRSTL